MPRLESRYNDSVPVTMQTFQIRDFQAADFDTLWSIDQECFPPGISYSRSELKSYMRRRGSFTLVGVRISGETVTSDLRSDNKSSVAISHSDSGIVGFVVTEAGRGVGHVITIDVVAAARRFGVGSLLLRQAEDRLRRAGCGTVELETAVDNVSALSFYKRHSYTVMGAFPRYYSNGVDALVLEKSLAAK